MGSGRKRMADKTDRIILAFFHPPHQPTFIGATSISLFLLELPLLLLLIITGVETSRISPFDGGAISSSISDRNKAFLPLPSLAALPPLTFRPHADASSGQRRERENHYDTFLFPFTSTAQRAARYCSGRRRVQRLNMVFYDQR